MKARRKSKFLSRIALFFVVLLVVTAIPYVAGARSDREIEQAISQLLVERHPTDTPEWWRGLGNQAPRVIMSMSEKADDIYQRVRLVAALGNYPEDPAAVEYIRRQADTSSDDVIREKAIRAMGNSQGVKELDYLSKFLAHPAAQTRLVAAETIKAMHDTIADARVDEYLKTEKSSFIGERLRRERPTTRPLTPVSTSLERANPAFVGNWKGLLIYPAGNEGMSSRAVFFEIKVLGATKLDVTMVLPAQSKSEAIQRVHLPEASATRSLLSAKIPGNAFGALLKANSPIAVTGELEEQAGQQILMISIESQAATIVVRKSP